MCLLHFWGCRRAVMGVVMGGGRLMGWGGGDAMDYISAHHDG